MNWDLSIEPEIVEILPDCDLLLNKLVPLFLKFGIVAIVYWFIVRAGAYHVEQGGDRVQRVAHL